MINIAIRVEGSPEIGMGHVMRCLSLAKEFKKTGCTVLFFSTHEDGIKKITSEGFEVIEIKKYSAGNGNLDPGTDADHVISAVVRHKIDLLIVDSYKVTNEYFRSMKPHVKKLAYIDDLNTFVYPVDILINGNVTGEYMDYKKYYEDEMLLLGPGYNLIRSEFNSIPERRIQDQAKAIMLTTGGSDPFHLSMKIADILFQDKELQELKLNIIVGGVFDNKEELREWSKGNHHVVLHENIKQISQVMLQSDIAISSGGSTLYELCACGTPTLAFVMADNQEFLVQKMSELNYIESLGWYHEFSGKNLVSKVKGLCNDFKRRCNLGHTMQKLVDGRGSGRVVTEILKMF